MKTAKAVALAGDEASGVRNRMLAGMTAAFVCVGVLLFCSAAFADPPQTLNGLERVQGGRVALAFVRPGTDWTKYKTIALRTLSIPASARNAAPKGAVPEFGESYLLRDEDVATLQRDFAQSFQRVLTNAGFAMVTTPQANTLIVVPQVVNITLTAPLEGTRQSYAGMGFTISQGGGSITMAAVLADGATGKVVAEVLDRKYGSNMWGLNDRVTNLAEARQAFDQWAHDLADKLQSP